MNKQNLNHNWKLREEPLSRGKDNLAEVLQADTGWLPLTLPTDIRVPLIEAGRIQDPVEGLASFDSEWIEDRSWWFTTTFNADPDLLAGEKIELVIESIDARGEVFLNGRYLGLHRSAHYPFTADVSELLRDRENRLTVRVTVGTENVTQQQVASFKDSVGKTYRRGDERRVAVRKPQYVFGWDWGPRIATCGLPKNVYLRSGSTALLRDCSVRTVKISEGRAHLRAVLEIDNTHSFATRECSASLAITSPDGGPVAAAATEELLLQSGINYLELDVVIEKPELWWPNGAGGQPLYLVEADVSCGNNIDRQTPFYFGIRTIELDTEALPDGERMFAIRVNGQKIFCKGGNWIPADSVYARVSDKKYRQLVEEAREANFTMLRIWGGGIYERDAFFDACDQLGILVWHDFMFACALYPDNHEWFRRESEREIDYQTRRLRSRACLALWCGNNENHWGFHDWWIGEREADFMGGAEVYNHVAPKAINANCPHIPYWRSSPYGGLEPNGNDIGDRHHWYDCTMNPDMEKRITPEEYDKVSSKFVSEYGYIGPCAKASIMDYHAGEPIEQFSELWNWHNNTFEKDTVVAGIQKHYVDSANLALDEYLLYAGLVQGLMYQYSLESIRSTKHCWGGLFWMYNDCWGEVGWTIIDYYLRRKPSYYYVKRAFAPIKLILRRSGGKAIVHTANDTGNEVSLSVEYGYMSFDGDTTDIQTGNITLAAGSKGPMLELPAEGHDENTGAYFVRSAPNEAVQISATLRSRPFRELTTGIPKLEISRFEPTDKGCRFSVSTDIFAHAVHFGLEEQYRFDDSYFDLLPGETRNINVIGINGPERVGPKAPDIDLIIPQSISVDRSGATSL